MEYQAKLNENTHLFYITFQVLNALIKDFKIEPPDLLVFISLHTEPHSALFEKNFLSRMFLFKRIHSNSSLLPLPLMSKIC